MVSSPLAKNFPLCPSGKSSLPTRAVPPRHEGRFAIVTNAGRDAVDADSSFDEWRYRGRRSRVVLMPRRWHQLATMLRIARGR